MDKAPGHRPGADVREGGVEPEESHAETGHNRRSEREIGVPLPPVGHRSRVGRATRGSTSELLFLSSLARAVTVRLAVTVDLYADGTCLFRRSMCEPPRYPPRRRVLLAVPPLAVLECMGSCARVAYRWMAIAIDHAALHRVTSGAVKPPRLPLHANSRAPNLDYTAEHARVRLAAVRCDLAPPGSEEARGSSREFAGSQQQAPEFG
jgi:hypothetical protein